MKKVVLLNNTRSCHAGTEAVMDNFRFLANQSDMEIINSWSIDNLSRFEENAAENIKNSADLVIINGEGTLHHNTPHLRMFDRLSDIKPTVLINTVWQANNKETEFLEKMKWISTRESFSKAAMLKSNPDLSVEVVPDLSLYSTGLPSFSKGHITGHQDSVLQYQTRWLSMQVNYFPMRQFGCNPSLKETVEWMQGLGFLVTGRFHGVCLAMMLRLPFIAVPSNTYKIDGMLVDAGIENLLIDSGEYNTDFMRQAAQANVMKAYEYGLQARQDIKKMFTKLKDI